MKISDALVVEGLGLLRACGHGVVKRTDGLPQPDRPLKDLPRHPAHRRAGRMGIVLGGRDRAGKGEGEGRRRRGPPARERQCTLPGDWSSVPQRMTQAAPCIRLGKGAYYFSTSGETRGSGPGNLGGQPKVPSRTAGADREMWPQMEPEATKLSGAA